MLKNTLFSACTHINTVWSLNRFSSRGDFTNISCNLQPKTSPTRCNHPFTSIPQWRDRKTCSVLGGGGRATDHTLNEISLLPFATISMSPFHYFSKKLPTLTPSPIQYFIVFSLLLRIHPILKLYFSQVFYCFANIIGKVVYSRFKTSCKRYVY